MGVTETLPKQGDYQGNPYRVILGPLGNLPLFTGRDDSKRFLGRFPGNRRMIKQLLARLFS